MLKDLAADVERRNILRVDETMQKIMDDLHSCEPGYRTSLLQRLLDIHLESTHTLSLSISHTLQALQRYDPAFCLPPEQLIKCTNRLLWKRSQPDIDGPAFAMLLPALTDYTVRIHSDSHLAVPPHTPAAVLWTLFNTMVRLLQSKHNELVLASLRRLVNSRVIPASALAELDIAGRNFGNIILTILLRTCMTLGWLPRAVYLACAPVGWDHPVPPAFLDTLIRILDDLLDHDTCQSNLHSIGEIITRYLSVRKVHLPHQTLNRFYERTAEYRADTIAIDVYRHVRSKKVMSIHRYPLPGGQVLIWLLRRANVNRDVHTMRLLLTQVMHEGANLPEPARPDFIQAAASHGMMSLARTLWERAEAVGDEAVLCNAAVLVRLVSLAESRVRHYQSRLRRRENSGRLPPDTASQPASHEDVTAATQYVIKNRWDKEAYNFVVEYRNFGMRVLETFVRRTEPLRQASHEKLNAIARAYIILDRITEGTRILQIITNRSQLPDLYDANVALSAVAVKDPSRAAQVIEEMVAIGMHPDAVTFGTVIHHAGLQGDQALVQRLIARSRELGNPTLTYKTIGNLIRTGVDPANNNSPPRDRLEKAKKMIDSLLEAGSVPSPNMGSTLR